jgi:hypothetical protein
MDGGRVVPAPESQRPARIIPPLPEKPQTPSVGAAKGSLKERFAKVFATGGDNSVGNGSTNGAVNPDVNGDINGAMNGAATSAANGLANGAGLGNAPEPSKGSAKGSPGSGAMTMTQPIARQMTAPAAEVAATGSTEVAEPMVAKLVRKVPKPKVLPPPMPTPPAPAPSSVAQTARQPSSTPVAPGQTRRARLRLTRVDPWSVMKTAFLLSVALGIVTVVSVVVVWSVLGSAGVWDSVNETIKGVIGDTAGSKFDIEDYVGMQRVLGFTALVAVIDVVLLTAIATLSAFLYNMAAALLGGLEVTLVEDN